MGFIYYEVMLTDHSLMGCPSLNIWTLADLSYPASGYNFLSKKNLEILIWQKCAAFFCYFFTRKGVSPEQGLCDQAFIVYSLLVKIFRRKLTDPEVLRRPCFSSQQLKGVALIVLEVCVISLLFTYLYLFLWGLSFLCRRKLLLIPWYFNSFINLWHFLMCFLKIV